MNRKRISPGAEGAEHGAAGHRRAAAGGAVNHIILILL